jgi:Tol biopolymer transport system component
MPVGCRAEGHRARPSLAMAALALAVGLTALGGARAVGAPGPRGRLLLVESTRSGTSEPYLVSLNGRATKRLPLGAGAELDSVSPLHHWITYYRHNGYWLSRLDGGWARRLPDGDEVSWAPNDRSLALHDVTGGPSKVIAPSGRLLAQFPLSVGGAGEWSSDSRWLALFPDSGPGEIDSINLDGSARRSLFGTATTSVEAASWSPDGSRVAYELGVDDEDSSGGPYADIYVARADGSGPVAITHDHGAQINGDPTWSPDGRWLAYERIIVGEDADIAQIWVARADGSERRQLTKGSLDLNPTWTPDGSKVVFDRGSTDVSTLLYQVGPDGKGLRRLGLARGVEIASFAPSGSEFVADLVKGEQAALALFTPSGKLLRQLTPLGQDWEPAFSPDGRSIAFSRNGSIAVLDEAGGAPRALTDSRHEDDERPAWTASGNRLSFEVLDAANGGTLDVMAPRSGKVLTVARSGRRSRAAC